MILTLGFDRDTNERSLQTADNEINASVERMDRIVRADLGDDCKCSEGFRLEEPFWRYFRDDSMHDF